MRLGHVFACSLVLAGSCLAESSRTEEREIRKAERAWLNSYLTRDGSVMDQIEADEFRIVYPDGRILTKSQELENLKKATIPQADLKLETEDEQVRIYGAAAI